MPFPTSIWLSISNVREIVKWHARNKSHGRSPLNGWMNPPRKFFKHARRVQRTYRAFMGNSPQRVFWSRKRKTELTGRPCWLSKMRRGIHICRSFLRNRSLVLSRRYRNFKWASYSTCFQQSCPCISIAAANHIVPSRLYSSASYRDPYKILNVSRSATPKEIRLAYFREAKKCHPDLHPGKFPLSLNVVHTS